jgi:hypothetical protein
MLQTTKPWYAWASTIIGSHMCMPVMIPHHRHHLPNYLNHWWPCNILHTQIRVSSYIITLSPTWDQFLTSKYSKFMDGIEQGSVLYSRTNSQTPCWSSRSEPYWAGLQYSSHFDNIHQCQEEPKDCHHIAVTSIAASILSQIWSEITPTSVGSSICVPYWRRMA